LQDNTIEQLLSVWSRNRFAELFPGIDLSKLPLDVSATADETRGDYQCNGAMALAKTVKQPPRTVAQKFVDQAPLPEPVQCLEIAGPGFINFRLKEAWLARRLEAVQADPRAGVPAMGAGHTVVLDYSSPNIAKPMHIGHIRSTVIGNALDRIHRFIGWNVISDNHVGDWGTQFGMLIIGWKRELDREALARDPIAELERIYKKVNQACEADETLREEARRELVKLQQGDAENRAIWQGMVELSEQQFNSIYGRLDVRFDRTLGESFYNDRLPGLVADLLARGVARESEGAVAVFSDGAMSPKDDPFRIHRDGEWVDNPCLVRKRDGGFNYATTDLATLAYRLETWSPDQIVYVTDGRQQLHFRQVFAAFRRWRPDVRARLVHVWFGTILGADGKPFRTRSGDTVKLVELLDEAEQRALAVVAEKSPELPVEQQREIARMVGLGAIKYADLSSNRQTDYVFDWDRMLALEGNTAPYLQYACARIASVRDKYAERFPGKSPSDFPIVLGDPLERRLAVRVLRFPDVLRNVAESYRPNILCDYLFDLAQVYSSFYQSIPFLKAEEGVRESRVRLCEVVARTLRTGLWLLGIETPNRI
jgi:arginyl-tRNA synthetase